MTKLRAICGSGSSMNRGPSVTGMTNMYKDDDSYARFYNGMNLMTMTSPINLDLSRAKIINSYRFLYKLKVSNVQPDCREMVLGLYIDDFRSTSTSGAEKNVDLRKLNNLGWQTVVVKPSYNHGFNVSPASFRNHTYSTRFYLSGNGKGTELLVESIKIEVDYSSGGDYTVPAPSNSVSTKTNIKINSDSTATLLPNIVNHDNTTYDVLEYETAGEISSLILRSPTMEEFNIPKGARIVGISLDAGISYNRDNSLDSTNLVKDETYITFGNKSSSIVASSNLSKHEDSNHSKLYEISNLNYNLSDVLDEAAEFVINYQYTDVATGDWNLYYLDWKVTYAVAESEFVSKILIDNDDISKIVLDGEEIEKMYLGIDLILGEQ